MLIFVYITALFEPLFRLIWCHIGYPGDVYFATTPQGQVHSQEPPVSQDGGRLEQRRWRRLKAETLSFQMTPPSSLEASTSSTSGLFFERK